LIGRIGDFKGRASAIDNTYQEIEKKNCTFLAIPAIPISYMDTKELRNTTLHNWTGDQEAKDDYLFLKANVSHGNTIQHSS